MVSVLKKELCYCSKEKESECSPYVVHTTCEKITRLSDPTKTKNETLKKSSSKIRRGDLLLLSCEFFPWTQPMNVSAPLRSRQDLFWNSPIVCLFGIHSTNASSTLRNSGFNMNRSSTHSLYEEREMTRMNAQTRTLVQLIEKRQCSNEDARRLLVLKHDQEHQHRPNPRNALPPRRRFRVTGNFIKEIRSPETELCYCYYQLS